jgi:flagellar P-ring protein precursor FlgI
MRSWLYRLLFLCSALIWVTVPAEAARVKDITDIYGIRDNNLLGYGLVTGLQRTGDTMRNQATIQTVAKRLQGLGITLTPDQIRSRNVAVVMVTASLPSTARPGQKIDVVVSSAGDAISLQGGVLQLTQLLAPNGEAFAVAQGPLTIGGFSLQAGGALSQKNHSTVGIVPMGATVERENPNRLNLLEQERLDFLLRNPDFTTAKRMADAINKGIGGVDDGEIAVAVDSGAITVKIPKEYKKDVVAFLALVEDINVDVDLPARIVINERTGTVVMGSEVKISNVAVAHGGITIEVRNSQNVSQPSPFTGGQTTTVENSTLQASEEEGNLTLIGGDVTINELVEALNALGVKPRDLIQILVAMKAAGALQAEIQVR